MSSVEFVDQSVEEVIQLSMEDLQTMKSYENISYQKREKESFKEYVMSVQTTDEDSNSNGRRRKTKLVRQQRYMSPDPQIQQLQKTTDVFTLRDLQEEMRDTT